MYKKKVSVIIPTYNRAGMIKRSIDSVLNQTYSDFELIVVDDGSTDHTEQIINNYEDVRLRYLRTEQRYGANHARNIGIENAEGEFIAFQDSDDFWTKDKLERQIQIFEQFPQIDVVWCRYCRIMSSGMSQIVPGICVRNTSQTETEKMLAKCNIIGTPTMVVRKKCFEEAGLFDEAIHRFQDWELCIRFVQRFRFYFMEEVLVEAYESKSSITNISSAMENQLAIITKHRDFFEKTGDMATQIGRLIELAVEEKKLESFLESLEEPLLIKGIYACVKKNINRKKNYAFVKEWIQRVDSTSRMNCYFTKHPDHSIVLYGIGEIGRLVLNTLSESAKKKIAFIIDKNVNILTEYEVIELEQLKNKDEKTIECIIITAIAHEEEIRRSIEEITTIRIVSLYDILRETC